MYVTGTFDDWSKSEKLVKTGDYFAKEVTLPRADEKIYYKVRDKINACLASSAAAVYMHRPAHFCLRCRVLPGPKCSACNMRKPAKWWLPAAACVDLALSGPAMQSHTGSRHATSSPFGQRRLHDVPSSDSLPPPLGSGER